jgi:hypothetical protein
MRGCSLHNSFAQVFPILEYLVVVLVIHPNEVGVPLDQARTLQSDLLIETGSKVLKETRKLSLPVGKIVDRRENSLAGEARRSLFHYQHPQN